MATTFEPAVLTRDTEMELLPAEPDGALYRRLYSYMLKCRMVEERIRVLYRQGRFAGNYFAAVGQEATEVGVTLDLLAEDTIAPSHRNFVTHIMKGTPLPLMFAQIYGRKTSPDQGRSAPAHCGYAPLNVITPSSTIAAQLNIGTGIALAYKMQRRRNVVVALSGEGSTSLGFWHEAVNFAGVRRLPILFVVENNGYAESVPVALQTAVSDISVKAAAYGIPGISVDGNDVAAVYAAAREAIDRARNGEGATLLECKTYRWYGHSEIDPAKYRDPAEVEFWKSRDPIPAMERRMNQWTCGRASGRRNWRRSSTGKSTKPSRSQITRRSRRATRRSIRCIRSAFANESWNGRRGNRGSPVGWRNRRLSWP